IRADATQLPTSCQPESLAKPARRRSHKATHPQLLTRRELDGRTSAAKASRSPCRRYSPMAHPSGRVIDTDTLISLVSHVSSDGQEHEQDSEDNPNVNAHQSRPAAVFPSRERLATGRRYLCFHFARSTTIRRISVLESTLS